MRSLTRSPRFDGIIDELLEEPAGHVALIAVAAARGGLWT
jgi:hypothetical protein